MLGLNIGMKKRVQTYAYTRAEINVFDHIAVTHSNQVNQIHSAVIQALSVQDKIIFIFSRVVKYRQDEQLGSLPTISTGI